MSRCGGRAADAVAGCVALSRAPAAGTMLGAALLPVTLALLSVAMAPSTVSAQVAEAVAPPSDTAGLSFPEALAIALRNNPSYLQQLNAVEAAEYSERARLGQAFLPSLDGSLGFGGGVSRRVTAEDDFGRPIEGTGGSTTASSASQGLSGSIPLLSLQAIRSYSEARALTRAAGAGVAYEAAVLRTQLGTDYFDAVRRRELVAVEERGLETARQNLAAIRQLLRLAAKDPTDVLGAELTVARAEQNLNQAVGEARKARLALMARMGVALDRAFTLTTPFPEVFDPSALDIGSLLARALAESPRLAQEEAGLEAARRGLSAARAARFPSLAGSYSYRRGTSREGYAAIGQFDLPNSDWGFGLSVDIPLFDRMGTHAAIGQAQVQADNAEESLREARLLLEQELRSALIDLENAYSAVRLAEQSADIARRRLEQGRERYRLGSVDYTALQDMVNAVTVEERGVINALYTFATALLAVEEKVGGPVRE